MNIVPRFAVLAFVGVAIGTAPAQAPPLANAPRFALPDVPYDYSPRVAAGLGSRFPLPQRDGGAPMRGCGPGAAPFVGPPAPDRFDDLATLGRVLFFDPLLSKNGTRSCASCHQPQHGFADPQPLSRGFHGRPTKRNSMAIANLGLHPGPFFWDGRVRTLEQMVLSPVEDAIEMGMTLDAVCDRLAVEPGYAELFTKAFGGPLVTSGRVAEALAQFVRSIVSLRSRYDEGLAAVGDVELDFPGFTPAENRGKRVFFGTKDRPHSCAACHVQLVPSGCGSVRDVVNLQGGFFVNGLDRGRAGDDPGRGAVTKKNTDVGSFRAPSLRNIELTAPYMHDGRFATLEEVVDFYASKVRSHANLDALLGGDSRRSWWGSAAPPVPAGAVLGTMHTIVGRPTGMLLTGRERADLVAFLKTLTDWELVRDERFADPFASAAGRRLARVGR